MASILDPPEINYRAIRDMGLAAWWGTSLMTRFGLGPASRALQSPAERVRVLNTGIKASTVMQSLAVTAYIAGTELVRFGPAQFGRYGVPKWVTVGVESKLRATLTGVALAAMVASRTMRLKAVELYRDHRGSDEIAEAESLLSKATWLQIIVPMCTAELLFSHLKQDMKETPPTPGGLLARLRHR